MVDITANNAEQLISVLLPTNVKVSELHFPWMQVPA